VQTEAEAAARYYAERSPRPVEAFVQELDKAVAEIELAPHHITGWFRGGGDSVVVVGQRRRSRGFSRS
jgi:hypothetical protein